MTILNQPDFVSTSIFRYQSYELDFESDFICACLACRQLIADAIVERAKPRSGCAIHREP